MIDDNDSDSNEIKKEICFWCWRWKYMQIYTRLKAEQRSKALSRFLSYVYFCLHFNAHLNEFPFIIISSP